MKTIFVFILLFVFIGVSAPINHRSKIKRIAYIEVGAVEQPDYILKSIIEVESSGREKIINKKEQAYGLLQIRKQMIIEANNIAGYNKYHLRDALSRKKSIEIWYLVQHHRNPNYDLCKACLIWNGVGKTSRIYHKKVLMQLNKFL